MNFDRVWCRAVTVLAVLASGGASGCPTNPPSTVSSVDINRYVGLWYQISAYEVFFNRGLVGVTAEYTLNDDGTVHVFNRGLQGSLDGPEQTIEGTARVVDTQTNSKLEVKFNFPLSNLFKGQYWIVDLDEQDYSYAVVSDSRRSTLFVLSRTPQLKKSVYNRILQRLEDNGFDTNTLVLTEQPTP